MRASKPRGPPSSRRLLRDQPCSHDTWGCCCAATAGGAGESASEPSSQVAAIESRASFKSTWPAQHNGRAQAQAKPSGCLLTAPPCYPMCFGQER